MTSGPLIIIGLVGHSGVGKTTLAKELEKEGFQFLQLGKYLKQLALRRNQNRINFSEVTANQKMDASLSEQLISHIKSRITPNTKGLVLGLVFSPEFVRQLQQSFPETDIYLVGVTANKKLRVMRFATRENISKKAAKRSVHMKDSDKTRTLERLKSILNLTITTQNQNARVAAKRITEYVRKHQRRKLIQTLRARSTHMK